MSKENEETPVVFRKYPEGDVIALFPTLDHASGNANRGRCLSYQHVGQHSEADYHGTVKGTTQAKYYQYKDLYEELERIGYHLKVHKSAPDGHPKDAQ